MAFKVGDVVLCIDHHTSRINGKIGTVASIDELSVRIGFTRFYVDFPNEKDWYILEKYLIPTTRLIKALFYNKTFDIESNN